MAIQKPKLGADSQIPKEKRWRPGGFNRPSVPRNAQLKFVCSANQRDVQWYFGWSEREQTVNVVNAGRDPIVDRDDEVARLNAAAIGDAVRCDFDHVDDLIG